MFIGLLLALLSGFCYGICFLPMRYMNRFAWENIWFLYTLIGTVILPVLTGYLTIPFLMDLYRQVGWRINLLIVVVGFLGGAGLVAYGLALAKIGMTLVNAIGNGLSLALGSFIPLIIQHREALHGRLGFSLIIGIALALLGVVICAVAASQRQETSAYMDQSLQKGTDLKRAAILGVVFTIVFGVMGANMNFALAFADDYVRIAKEHGASDVFSPFALFIPLLVPGLASAGFYFAYLWRKNKTLRQFCEPQAAWFTFLCLLISIVWFGATLFYGWAMPWMKSYGPVLGWPVMMASISIVSAVVEWLYGDWKGRALRTLSWGLLTLTASIVALGYGNWLIQRIA
jgi:L-rhamnose-H+ transport protein